MLYTIKNPYLEVQINSIGAEIKSIKYQGNERLHDSNPTYWNRSAPILFPNIGKLINNETKINNQSYKLPKHGFLRDQEMELTHHTDTDICFKLTQNEETLKVYPFNFEILIKYHLILNELHSTIIIKNDSNYPMPFNLGLHPAFKVPLNKGEQFEDYQLIFDKIGSYKTPLVDLSSGTIDFTKIHTTYENLKQLSLNYNDYQDDAIILDPLPFNKVTLINPKQQKVIFQFNGFKTLGIWTPNHVHANFICLEPWCGCADLTNHDGIFEHKKDIIMLDPLDTRLFSYQLKFE